MLVKDSSTCAHIPKDNLKYLDHVEEILIASGVMNFLDICPNPEGHLRDKGDAQAASSSER